MNLCCAITPQPSTALDPREPTIEPDQDVPKFQPTLHFATSPCIYGLTVHFIMMTCTPAYHATFQ